MSRHLRFAMGMGNVNMGLPQPPYWRGDQVVMKSVCRFSGRVGRVTYTPGIGEENTTNGSGITSGNKLQLKEYAGNISK
jgi:hypothetical protein